MDAQRRFLRARIGLLPCGVRRQCNMHEVATCSVRKKRPTDGTRPEPRNSREVLCNDHGIAQTIGNFGDPRTEVEPKDSALLNIENPGLKGLRTGFSIIQAREYPQVVGRRIRPNAEDRGVNGIGSIVRALEKADGPF